MHGLIVRFWPPQLSSTGYAAAAELWPDVFSSVSGDRQSELMAGMRVARARLVSGFESMVMVRGPCGVPSPACGATRFEANLSQDLLRRTIQLCLPT